MGDYIIGACLFFVATVLLFSAIRRWGPTGDLRVPAMQRAPEGMAQQAAPRSFVWRWTAMAVLVLLSSVSYVRAMMIDRPQGTVSDPKALGRFPQQVGKYKLTREWNESLVTGALIFYWADYKPDDGGAVVSVGISPVLGAHDTLLCHSARGEDWLWHGNLEFPTADGATSFSGSFFNDGATQYLEATTVCTGESCGQYSTSQRHFGLVYSRPDTKTLLSASPTRPIPVLLRTEDAGHGHGGGPGANGADRQPPGVLGGGQAERIYRAVPVGPPVHFRP